MQSLEEGVNIKSGQRLLKVPSRSSSQQKTLSNLTSTRSSAVTVGESRSSIGGVSKESKESFVEMSHIGTEAEQRSHPEIEPTSTGGHTQPSSPATSEQKQRKRKGGFLSFLGCCGSDAAGSAEGDKENVHKLDKLPQRPTTAKRTAAASGQDATSKHANDKNQQAGSGLEDENGASSSHDANTASEELTSEQKHSATTNQHESSDAQDSSSDRQAGNASANHDNTMQDATEETSNTTTTANDRLGGRTIPPPPPGPVPTSEPVVDVAVQEPRKWLLPPIAPEHKGRKCLVLDLDETLVHSSFKVNICTPGFGTRQKKKVANLTNKIDSSPS